jgi:hypothetical protein
MSGRYLGLEFDFFECEIPLQTEPFDAFPEYLLGWHRCNSFTGIVVASFMGIRRSEKRNTVILSNGLETINEKICRYARIYI